MSIINHRELAIVKLAEQVKEATNLINYIRTLLQEGDNLEAVYQDLLEKRNLEDAAGGQLDIIGAIVGQPRPVLPDSSFEFFGFQGVLGIGGFGSLAAPETGGLFRGENTNETGNVALEDAQYRRVIQARIIKNTSTGTIEEIIATLLFLIDNVNTVTIIETISATENEFSYQYDRSLNVNEVVLLTELDIIPRPVGVRANYTP